MELDVGQVRQPDQRRAILRQRVVDIADLAGLDPLGAVGRRLLLVEVLLIYAIRIALQRQGPIAQMRDEGGRRARVVGDQIALGEPDLRKEDLVPVGDLQRPAVDGDRQRALRQTLDLVEQRLWRIGIRRRLGLERHAGRRCRLQVDIPGRDVLPQALV